MPLQPASDLWSLGYRLTFAEIEVVSTSDPGHVRTLLWEDLDRAPSFPVLTSFIESWRAESDLTLTSLKVTTLDGVTPDQLALRAHSLAMH
jgi:uncharacterized protein Usg